MKIFRILLIILSGCIMVVGVFLLTAIFKQPRVQAIDFSSMTFEEIRAFHEGTGAQNVSAGIGPKNPFYFCDQFGEWVILRINAKNPSKQLERITLFSQEKVAEMVKSDATSYANVNAQLTHYLDAMAQLFVMEKIDTTEDGQAARSYALRALRSEQDQLVAIAQNNQNEIVDAMIAKILRLQDEDRQREAKKSMPEEMYRQIYETSEELTEIQNTTSDEMP